MSNTPSDELRLLIQEARSALWQPANAELCERIDDAFARCGTPQQAVQEPFCYVSVNKQGDITRTMKRKDKWTNIPLYTTPQPTQVQRVVRRSLTCEWTHNEDDGFWGTECGQSWRFDDGGPKENHMNFCHSCGKPLRIKGGQNDL